VKQMFSLGGGRNAYGYLQTPLSSSFGTAFEVEIQMGLGRRAATGKRCHQKN
jgi:hypothetical protein